MATGARAAEIDFNRDIRPILSDKCYACHGPAEEKVKGGYRASDRDISIKIGAIVPGDPSKSILIERILTPDADEVMPPPESQKQLSGREKELLRQWIRKVPSSRRTGRSFPPGKKPFQRQPKLIRLISS